MSSTKDFPFYRGAGNTSRWCNREETWNSHFVVAGTVFTELINFRHYESIIIKTNTPWNDNGYSYVFMFY